MEDSKGQEAISSEHNPTYPTVLQEKCNGGYYSLYLTYLGELFFYFYFVCLFVLLTLLKLRIFIKSHIILQYLERDRPTLLP